MAPDRYKYFRVEARELLGQLAEGLLSLEKAPPSGDLVPRLLRLAHTLKGAARVVKHREIADHAHAVEDALAPLRDSAEPPPRRTIDEVLRILDAAGACVADLALPGRAEGAAAAPPAVDPVLQSVRADIADMDALLGGVSEAQVRLADVQEELNVIERMRRLVSLLLEQLAAPRVGIAEQPGNGHALGRARSLAEDLHRLVDASGRGLTGGTDRLARELRQVREAAERLRLVPAGVLFNSLERTVRDAAETVGRSVAFESQGGDARLDAHVLGVAQDALVQMVRNAVAHGIESEAERRTAGKPIEGRVAVMIERRRTRVAFRCSDDGRGVDVEAVRRAAERKGMLAEDTRTLGPEELLHLLLRGGISTSGAVTEVAGRGIGLDVVREAAARLGGEVSVRTEPGKGTELELVVPLSLSSLAAIIVEAAGQTIAIPLDAVRRTLRIAAAEVTRTADSDFILYEGKAVPFVPLGHIFGKRTNAPAASLALTALVVDGGGGGMVAVGVDRLRGFEDVVLRPLPDTAPADPLVAGASIDAQGNPQIVIDPQHLVDWAHRIEPPAPPAEAARPPILVVDDSLTTRMLEQSILESAGYEVDLATSGEEAMDKAGRRRYALFLVDIEMPGMDGFTFVERTRGDPHLRGVPALLVTSRSSAEDRRRGKEVGAHAFIVKSEFDQTALLDTIRELVT
ncbi:MAG: response regulator [Proteobacteria bacterium]|nr:response regulator [Pseudomonadota bacterium]